MNRSQQNSRFGNQTSHHETHRSQGYGGGFYDDRGYESHGQEGAQRQFRHTEARGDHSSPREHGEHTYGRQDEFGGSSRAGERSSQGFGAESSRDNWSPATQDAYRGNSPYGRQSSYAGQSYSRDIEGRGSHQERDSYAGSFGNQGYGQGDFGGRGYSDTSDFERGRTSFPGAQAGYGMSTGGGYRPSNEYRYGARQGGNLGGGSYETGSPEMRNPQAYGSGGRGVGEGFDRFYPGSNQFNFGHQSGGYQRGGTGRGQAPKGYQRSDERIHEDVCERIMDRGLDAGEVEIRVEQGEVTLTGMVHERTQKRMIEDVAESVSGVQEVHNQIRVARESAGRSRQEEPLGASQTRGRAQDESSSGEPTSMGRTQKQRSARTESKAQANT